jgi:hypothetical protein
LVPLDHCSPCEEFCGITGGFVHELPSDIEDITILQNRITEHSADLVLDFELITSGQRKFLRLFRDPFNDTSEWAVVEKAEYGVSFRELHVWGYSVLMQENYARRYLSPITQLAGDSSIELHNAVLSIRSRPSMAAFMHLLGVISQSPVADVAGTVTDTFTDSVRGSIVVISDRTYRSASGVLPIVVVGDSVVAGDRLFDGFEIAELGHQYVTWDTELRLPGELFNLANVPYLSLSLLDVPVTVSGVNRRVFDVGPSTGDYWDYVYSRDADLVLQTQQLLGGRASINPYAFFVEQRLRNGFVAVRLRGELITDSVDAVRILHKCLPPTRTLLLQIIGDVPAALQKSPPPCCVI